MADGVSCFGGFMDKPQLSQLTPVDFSIPPISGNGTICGVSNTGIPGLGRGYIVEINDIRHSDNVSVNYPYTHMIVYESQLKELSEGFD
jgi:hypothetical protein